MTTINKPEFDKRSYLGGELDNGIKYITINDTHLEKTYVSVCVKTGSYANPGTHNGLAHFLEHMLFMGSKKYPSENHYSKRLNELGGYSNAYTDVLETVYYFTVFNHGLVEIMDIFSHFFIDPLFDPDAVSREVNAVDSEHKKNVNDDTWKKFQLGLYLANPETNINTFITGSHNTLNKEDVREKMIEFYDNYYKSNNISICVASSMTHDEVKKIIDSTFGNIKKSTGEAVQIVKPFYRTNISKTFYLKTSSNIYELTYIWEIPTQDQFILSKDFTILDNILNDRSEESLYFMLKNLGYLHYISVEIKHEGVFSLTCRLTRLGFNNISHIESLLFNYLNQIYTQDLSKFASYYQKTCSINFNTLNKFDTMDLCNLMSVNHHYYDTSSSLDGCFLIKQIKNTNDYIDLYKSYINKDNFIRVLSSDSCTNISTGIEIDSSKLIKLREYDTYYTEINLPIKSKNIYDNTSTCCLELKNAFLDLSLRVKTKLDCYEKPILLSERQWYGGNSSYCEPSLNIWLQFNNNLYFSCAKNYVLTGISSSILNFLISTIMSKPLELCYSISFDTKPSTSSIVVNIKAPNDVSKLDIFTQQFCDFMLNLDEVSKKITDEHIKNLIVSFREGYMNTNFLNPWGYSAFIVTSRAYNTEYTIEELVKAIDSINYTEIRSYISSLLKHSALTSFIYGNVDPRYLKSLFGKLDKLYSNPLYILPRINKVSDIAIKHPNKSEKSNCITYYYYISKFLPREFILMNLVVNILSEPFFDNIRTKNQLGYMVKMTFTSFRDEYFIIQKVQSDKAIELVESKLDDFNNGISNIIKNTDLSKFITTLRNQVLEPDASLTERFMRYLPEISLRQYLFCRRELLLVHLDKVTVNDVNNFIKHYLNSRNRTRVIIHS